MCPKRSLSFKLIGLALALVLIVPILGACGGKSVDQEGQEILDFINDSNNAAVMERATSVEDDWNEIMSGVQTYTRLQLIYELGLLEQRAGTSYREMAEVVPPKCLRSFWDKEVEASKLTFQAICNDISTCT